jgi:hypothetical protein
MAWLWGLALVGWVLGSVAAGVEALVPLSTCPVATHDMVEVQMTAAILIRNSRAAGQGNPEPGRGLHACAIHDNAVLMIAQPRSSKSG